MPPWASCAIFSILVILLTKSTLDHTSLSNMSAPTKALHPGYFHPVMRSWQRQSTLKKSDLVYPIFVCDEANAKQPIASMPEQHRWGVNRLSELLDPLVKQGLSAVLIFGVLTQIDCDDDKKPPLKLQKDAFGSVALSERSPVILALRYLRKKYPSLLLIADVCLCAYTSHGHCGILNGDGFIDNARSIDRIADVALHFAENGADIVAPSDMMDGRVKRIKQRLHERGLAYKCAVMSYSSKYCSNFYGPFRDAAHSAPSAKEQQQRVVCNMHDRSTYQLPVSSRGLGIRASVRCFEEGADFLMVKPGLPYLDILRDVKNNVPHVPIAVYQVSGEYAMLWHGAKHGAFELKAIVLETCQSFVRAGAQIIITYYAPQLLQWLNDHDAKL
mmetsp:Transcript_57361/g.95324  ORF Transcript_57361/g.95324 Transcript_57361/m.95324 type:complete len:387 (-) Transcript_57361:492-1652(-)